VWARDGRELFYRSDDKMMVVSLVGSQTVTPSTPAPLFSGDFELSAPGYPNYDVHLDGRRFVMIQRGDDASEAPREINVVLNWFEELRQRVPTN
jgi:hypothetical protein